MTNKVIHLNYNSSDATQWLITLKDGTDYMATPKKYEEELAKDFYNEEYEPHIRLALNAYHLLKAVTCIGVKTLHARYYCNPLPAMLVTMWLDTGDKAEVTINLYSPDGKVELTSNREIWNFDIFKRDVQVEFKPIRQGIFKPVSRHFYVIDVNHLLHMLENNSEVVKTIKWVYKLAQEISKEALK